MASREETPETRDLTPRATGDRPGAEPPEPELMIGSKLEVPMCQATGRAGKRLARGLPCSLVVHVRNAVDAVYGSALSGPLPTARPAAQRVLGSKPDFVGVGLVVGEVRSSRSR